MSGYLGVVVVRRSYVGVSDVFEMFILVFLLRIK